MTPREFRMKSPEDRAEMHAHYTVNNEIDMYFECEKSKAYDKK